jgi:hypothetical protein
MASLAPCFGAPRVGPSSRRVSPAGHPKAAGKWLAASVIDDIAAVIAAGFGKAGRLAERRTARPMELSGGLLLGTLIDPQKIQVPFALVLLPMTMLGCVYYPWSALHSIRWLQIAVLANPLVYASEGLRAMLTPQLPHMTAAAFLGVLIGGTALLCWLASRTFTARVLT